MNVSMQFPQIGSRFVDKEGRIDQAWLQLLITIWNRTGTEQGTPSTDIQYDDSQVNAQLLALRDELQGIPTMPAPDVLSDVLRRLDDLEARQPAAAPADDPLSPLLLMGG